MAVTTITRARAAHQEYLELLDYLHRLSGTLTPVNDAAYNGALDRMNELAAYLGYRPQL
jgi:hypothetical protein